MALPGNTSTVVVLGTFLTPEGDASTGSVTFTASSWLTNSGANVSIPNSSVTKALGTAGDFTVTLPITDDPDITPLEFIYTVSEVVDGVSRNYNISIPGTVAAGGTVYLADLAPVAPAGPEYYSLASSLSIGTVTTLAAGSAATATITGLAPEQTLDLGIPTGPKGDTGDTGATGPQGSAATIEVGSVTAGTAGGTPSVTNSGTSGSAVLDFVLIPGDTGATGPAGAAATIEVGTVTTGTAGGSASVTNSGTTGSAVFDFVIPRGDTGATGATGPQGSAATIEVGSVSAGTAGGTPTVTNSGTTGSAVLDFVLIPGDTGPTGATGATGPVGPQGSAATVEVGTVTTGTAGGTASVTNSGTSGSAVLDFVIPRGDTGATGATGPQGTAASITVGTVTSVAYGGTASVTNTGTSTDAVLDFVLVTGPQGDLAGLSATAPIDYAANNFSLLYGAGLGTATGGTLVADLSDATPQALGAAASGTATTISRADHVHATPSAADVGAVGTATTITAGTGLAGGGDLTTSRTLDVVLSTATPAALGAAGAGTANNPARGDHVHAMPSAADVGAVGTATTITAGTGLSGGGDLSASRTLDVDFSASTPAALGTAAAGTAVEAARGDHVHAMPTASDVGAVANSVVTAKGDLIVASGSGAVDELAVGTDGHVLTADSNETLGVKWSAPTGGGGAGLADVFLLMGA